MDLQIKEQSFLVGGATSGFGLATSKALMNEGAKVIGVARSNDDLLKLQASYPDLFIPFTADITKEENINEIARLAIAYNISGVFINAGGPPAMKFEETTLQDWDEAYKNLLRWKVNLIQQLLPHFKSISYGRIVMLESSSVKQPIENLVLSTSLRLAVVGLMKTLSQEVTGFGVNFNLIAPGSHETPAIERLIEKKAIQNGTTVAESRENYLNNLPMKKMGNAEYLGSLAAWLLSPLSEFVNGQVYAIEGGVVKSTL